MKLGKRKCKNCGESFQKKQPLQYCCSIPCGIEYSRKMTKKKEDQEWNKTKKEKMEKLKGITEWIHGWKKRGWKKSDKKPVVNKDLWQQLDTLNNERDVTWKWVKGHAGVDGNERADELARMGMPDRD